MQLQTRSEELQKTNLELQEKAGLLAHQNQEVERKNREVEQARQALEDKAKQLALTSKYKSEFLANMSHELRTPLNSLLILSDQLSRNPEGNLLPRQTEFAKTIHSSGNDLLMLINDILDLSKIESGTVMVDTSELRLADLQNYVERTFRHVAESKNLDFVIQLDPRLPKSMLTDAKRLQQVIKNLLSNAFKFTQHGRVALTVEPVHGGWNPDNEGLNHTPLVLAFAVTDTGIGIAPDKQQIIFEAFQQADGSTSRKFGGTGLGLAISRELSRLLGGEIKLSSMPGRGSTFTLYLPQTYSSPKSGRRANDNSEGQSLLSSSRPLSLPEFKAPPAVATPLPEGEQEAGALVNEVGDDRHRLQPGEPVLLIVENDLTFARLMLESARDKGFKVLVTSLGAAALALTHEYKPDAITLDLHLPDIDGWRVLERLKHDIHSRHIPVCVVSTDESRERALEAGAAGFVAKPVQTASDLDALVAGLKDFVDRPIKSLLLLSRPPSRRQQLLEGLDGGDFQVTAVATGQEALQMLRERRSRLPGARPGCQGRAVERPGRGAIPSPGAGPIPGDCVS